MQPVNRILLNTIILYVKILVCMGISLYTVPVVLHALGQSDYGLFTVIAGVISMLSFINASMTISTQRYLSVTMGENNKRKLIDVYNLSILLHILLAGLIIIIIECPMSFMFDHILNIDPNRINVARTLFHLLVINMFFTILSVPFDAVMNAYEDMLAFSVISIIEAILKFIVAIFISFFPIDGLEFYGVGLCVVSFIICAVKFLYTRFHFTDLILSTKACRNKKLFVELLSFAGWNAFSAFAIVVRYQGVAIILNHFWGTIVNAAYGIGYQINGVLGYFSATIQKSINPQLMMSEGAHEQHNLFNMSFALTKFSCLLLAIIAIPLIIEMHSVLHLWLHDGIPQNTVEFARIIILISLIYQASSGLMSVIQSSGRIKWYTITICVILMLSIPLTIVGIYIGIPTAHILWGVCLSELIAFFVRLYFAKKILDFPVWEYCIKVITPIAVQTIAVFCLLYVMTLFIKPSFTRILMTTLIDITVFGLLTYLFVLTPEEKKFVINIINKVKLYAKNN